MTAISADEKRKRGFFWGFAILALIIIFVCYRRYFTAKDLQQALPRANSFSQASVLSGASLLSDF
tara:strand:- start:6937 stop:7131 length:195 start_codon:yes stop_codon:yes gene_type:complete